MLATLSVAAIVASGCTAGAAGGDKAGGGGEPVVLRVADTASDLGYTPALKYFINRVNELSGGDIRISVVYGWGNFSADVEQQAVRDVAAGKADLTWVGTRVFDTMGVRSFQALSAPMLIDSYALEDAVVRSDVPGQMLRGLDPIGVAGLAMLAASLPKLIAVQKPLLGPADWRGITFQAYKSQVQAEAIRALGAQPLDLLGPALDDGLKNGQIQGFAKSLLAYQSNNQWRIAPYVTVNVNLWPGMAVLLANPGRLSRLSEEQRGWIQRAARDAADRSTGLVQQEDQIVADLCQHGARFANASEGNLAALRQALVPVYSSLERDPQTRSFIASIEQLKRSTPAGPPLAIPAGCTGSAPGSQMTNDPIAGSWRTGHLDESQIVRAWLALGGSEKAAHDDFREEAALAGATHYIVVSVTFHDGMYDQYVSGDGGPLKHQDTGTYRIADGHTFTLSAGGCSSTLRYDLSADTLRLHMVKPWCDPYVPVGIASFPFTRSG